MRPSMALLGKAVFTVLVPVLVDRFHTAPFVANTHLGNSPASSPSTASTAAFARSTPSGTPPCTSPTPIIANSTATTRPSPLVCPPLRPSLASPKAPKQHSQPSPMPPRGTLCTPTSASSPTTAQHPSRSTGSTPNTLSPNTHVRGLLCTRLVATHRLTSRPHPCARSTVGYVRCSPREQ